MLTDADRKVLETYLERPLMGNPVTDLFAVFSKMVENGEWEEFVFYIEQKYKHGYAIRGAQNIAWLSCYGIPDQIPERMKMAVNFIEGRK